MKNGAFEILAGSWRSILDGPVSAANLNKKGCISLEFLQYNPRQKGRSTGTRLQMLHSQTRLDQSRL
jgi:hypothetical protein